MCFSITERELCFQASKEMCSNKTEREFSAFTVTKTVGYVSHILRNDSSVLSS